MLLAGRAIAEKGRDKVLYYEIIQSLASLYLKQRQYERAFKLFLASYNRPEAVPFNPNKKVGTLSGLAEIYLLKKQHHDAIKMGEDCLAIVRADTSIDFANVDIYKILAQAYFAIGNVQKGQEYNNQFYAATAYKFKASTAEALQNLETKYQTQKKELALQKSRASNKQKNLIILSSLPLAFLLALIGYLLFRQQRLRNQQLINEHELKQALIKIENQNNLQQQRIEISKELHDNIGSQLTFIIASLDNLKQFDVEHLPLFEKVNQIGDFTRDTINDLRDTV